jgi:hypothetical protein
MRVRVEVTGSDEVRRSLARLGKAGQEAARKVLGAEVQAMLPEIRRDTPVDPEDGGQLRDSVRATKPTITRTGRVSAGVVAGGAPLRKYLGTRKANVYAVVQHEDMTAKHTTGGPKFVERTFMRRAPRIPAKLMDALDWEAQKA